MFAFLFHAMGRYSIFLPSPVPKRSFIKLLGAVPQLYVQHTPGANASISSAYVNCSSATPRFSLRCLGWASATIAIHAKAMAAMPVNRCFIIL